MRWNIQVHVARGLARAFLAGEWNAADLCARAAAALGAEPTWLPELVNDVLVLSVPARRRLGVEGLAGKIQQSAWFVAAFDSPDIATHPSICKWFVCDPVMAPPPLGLDSTALPILTNSQMIAHWLGVELAELNWLSQPSWRLARASLGRQHYRFRIVPKRTGGYRLIEAPHSRLKAVQRKILNDLLSRVPLHQSCHGFVPGRSILTHAGSHSRQSVVIKFDLQDFFASISTPQVVATLRTLGYPAGAAQTLAQLCTLVTPASVIERLREDGSITWHQAKKLSSGHLAQGAPTSPALANLCAFSLDLRCDGLAQTLGATYTRYADDLVFSGPRSLAGQFGRTQAWVGMIAREEGYAINHRKTRLQTQASRQVVTGIVVNEMPNIARKDFDRMRAELHRLAIANVDTAAPMPDESRARWLGQIAWVNQTNPARAAKLHTLFSRCL
ncbi:MAG: reverse transcriptase family protein [Burkholderiaceae bacterium]